jgi:hypothetical protein
MSKQTKQATTGVVAFVRGSSVSAAFAFTGERVLTHIPASAYPMNDGTDLTPALGTRAWSPPV